MTETAIRTQKLAKRFGEMYAVRGVTFDVPKATIFGFMGPSGSGKTTTIRMLTGTYHPTAGEAEVLGASPATFDQRTQARIGYMPQFFSLYPDLTVWENLSFAASIYGLGRGRRKRMRQVLDLVELSDHAKQPVREISGGMRRRLSLAATLIHDPDLYFLDEPTTGLDPVLRNKFWEHFKELKNQGKTLFITTQYVNEAANCDRIALLIEGRVLALDSPDRLRQQAFGGDIIEVKTEQTLGEHLFEDVMQCECVEEITQITPREFRVVAREAATAIPELIRWLKAHGIDTLFVEEYLPPFDDVFVALVEGHENVQENV